MLAQPDAFRHIGKWSFLFGMFLLVSQLHLHFNPAYGSVENIFWLGAVGVAATQYQKIQLVHVGLMVLIFFALLSTYLSGGLVDPAWQTNIKYFWMSILFVLAGHLLIQSKADVDKFQNFFIVASAILVPIFFYRYLVLHEVREFDERPVLNLRNGDPNFLAFIFTLAFFLALELKNKYLKILAPLLFATAVIATQSRMGVLSLLIGAIALGLGKLRNPRHRFLLLGGVVCMGLVTLLSIPDLMVRFENMMDKSNMERVKTWENGLQLFAENPWLGVGLDNSEKFYFKNQGYPMFQSLEDTLTVHNAYFKMLAEMGMIGSLPLWIWLVTLLRRGGEGSLQMKVLLGVVFFNAFFIGICFKDFYLLALALLDCKQTQGALS